MTEIELRIAEVDGPGPVGLAGVGIAEVGITTPDGPLDLREFVRTPDDLAIRAAPTTGSPPSSPRGRRGTSCDA